MTNHPNEINKKQSHETTRSRTTLLKFARNLNEITYLLSQQENKVYVHLETWEVYLVPHRTCNGRVFVHQP